MHVHVTNDLLQRAGCSPTSPTKISSEANLHKIMLLFFLTYLKPESCMYDFISNGISNRKIFIIKKLWKQHKATEHPTAKQSICNRGVPSLLLYSFSSTTIRKLIYLCRCDICGDHICILWVEKKHHRNNQSELCKEQSCLYKWALQHHINNFKWIRSHVSDLFFCLISC